MTPKERERERERERGKKNERRTHHSGVWRKRVAHNIEITGHDALSSKAITAVSINRPREM